jgi:hypothetical protein
MLLPLSQPRIPHKSNSLNNFIRSQPRKDQQIDKKEHESSKRVFRDDVVMRGVKKVEGEDFVYVVFGF